MINHSDSGILPILLKLLELKFKIRLIINPNVNVVKINIFFVTVIIKICSGDEIHMIEVPAKIEYGIIAINGISIIIMLEKLLSFLFFITNFNENLNIRMEYLAVIPRDIIIIYVNIDISFELIIYSIMASFE